MKLAHHQKLQIVTRGLIFREDHLLVTQWRGGYAFLIGGRVQHGEPLQEATLREVWEETGARGRIDRLVYFSENFWHQGADQWHEYGWYYVVETQDPICPLDAQMPNPDHPDLFIHWVPVTQVPDLFIYPSFLKRHLLEDYRSGFAHAPRHMVTDQRLPGAPIREIDDGPSAA